MLVRKDGNYANATSLDDFKDEVTFVKGVYLYSLISQLQRGEKQES